MRIWHTNLHWNQILTKKIRGLRLGSCVYIRRQYSLICGCCSPFVWGHSPSYLKMCPRRLSRGRFILTGLQSPAVPFTHSRRLVSHRYFVSVMSQSQFSSPQPWKHLTSITEALLSYWWICGSSRLACSQAESMQTTLCCLRIFSRTAGFHLGVSCTLSKPCSFSSYVPCGRQQLWRGGYVHATLETSLGHAHIVSRVSRSSGQ